MRNIKRTAFGFAALLVLVAGGVFALVLVVGGAGQSAVEAWAGRELKAVAGAYLKPQLEFDTIDYQAPRTLVLTHARLSAQDPDHPGQRIDIIDAKRIRVELSELPREGQPLRLESIELEGVNIRLVDAKQGGLVGFSDFVLAQSPTDAPKLSEVLQIKQIVIRDGAIEYDARTPATEPMRFDKIDTTVNLKPGEGGAYDIALVLDRQDVIDLDLDASIDLNTMSLAVNKLTTELDMSRQQDRYLPPQVQAFIKRHDLTGRLSLNGSGALDINAPANSSAKLTLTLNDALGTVGDYRMPIQTLTVDARMAERAVTIDRLAGHLLGGEISGDGAVSLDGEMPAKLNLSGNKLRLGELMAANTQDDGPPIAGKIDLQVNANAPLMLVLQDMRGKGEVRLSEGRIARLPLISGLIDFMESAGNLNRRKDAPAGRDKGKAVFELRGDHAYLSELHIEGTWFEMQGKGRMYFDNRLAMNINAGPLEKVLGSIGPLGQAINRVKNGMVTYGVRGPFDDLTIRPVPLGGIIGAPGENE